MTCVLSASRITPSLYASGVYPTSQRYASSKPVCEKCVFPTPLTAVWLQRAVCSQLNTILRLPTLPFLLALRPYSRFFFCLLHLLPAAAGEAEF